MSADATLRTTCDALFAPWDRADSPGAAVAITRQGGTVLRACYGMADLAHALPIDSRTVMRIGSQTKQFTVLLALMLEADGRLSFEDDVRRYAPWLPAYPARITLGHLAGNMGGQRDFLEAMSYSGLSISAPSSRETARQLIARQREVNFPPGQAMVYCNTGFFLLSEIIEEISGRSFNELLASRITGPLGMADTRLMTQDSQILPRLATHHTRGSDGAWRRAHWGVVLGGEGGMVSTLEDMLVWQANLDHPAVGTPDMIRRMATPGVYANGLTSIYGLGLVSGQYRGLRAVGHGGTVAGGKSESVRFPDQGFGVVILGNCDDLPTFSLARRIADAALADHMSAGPDPAELGRLTEAAGVYRQVGGDDVIELVERSGEPMFLNGGGAVAVEQLGPNRFQPERGVMHLELSLDADGIAASFCGEPRRYRRLQPGADPTAPAPEGTFYSAAAGVTAEIVPGAENLMLRLRSEFGVSAMPLTHLAEDLYLAGGQTGRPWTFVLRAANDAVILTSDRTRGLRLARTH